MARKRVPFSFAATHDVFDVMRRASLVRQRHKSGFLMQSHVVVGIQENQGNARQILEAAGVKGSLEALALDQRMFEPFVEFPGLGSPLVSPYVLSAIDGACGAAIRNSGGIVDTEHLLLGLLSMDSDATLLIALAGLDVGLDVDNVIAQANDWSNRD